MLATAKDVYRLNINAHASAQSIASSLHVWRHALHDSGRDTSRAAILLESGSGVIGGAGEPTELNAPSLAWLPIRPDHYLRLAAGSRGELLILSDMLVKDAIGQGAESARLRFLNDRVVAINRLPDAQALAEAAASFVAVGREVRRDERGSWNYLAAHVALVLVQCWRLSGLEDVSLQEADSGSSLLLRFRHLVEIHYGQRWRVAQYAQALGITHDRLHDACWRGLRRTPLELLHDRLTHEARLRLVRSGLTIERLADELGFRSASHFTRFFKQRTGFTPAAYRRAGRQAGASSSALATPTYADWP